MGRRWQTLARTEISVSDTVVPASPAHWSPKALADFSAGPRTLLLAAMALVVGSLATAAAWCLVSLIALVANLV